MASQYQLASDQECRDLVNRILASNEFKRATKQREFLLYVLDRKLAGCPEEVTEPIIGHRVYGRRPDYNSGDDSIVRTEARTLRKRLERYFEGEGIAEPLVLDIPRGGYLPVFRRRALEPVVPPREPAVTPAVSRRQWLGIGACAAVGGAAFVGFRNYARSREDESTVSRAPGLVQLESSDQQLNIAFQLAKQRALSCVYSGDPVGEWYATRPDGESNVFCMRDASHQSVGAAVLGLSRHTTNMLRRFALSVARSRNWCGYWIMTKDGIPDSRVYASDKDFGYCLPAGFDVLRACHRQLLWTGDSAYLGPEFFNFYERTAIDFPLAWDPDRDGIMSNLDRPRIHASYFQKHPPFLTGADLLAAQYAGFNTYSAMQESLGREGSLSNRLAKEFRNKADALRARFNSEWWNSSEKRFESALLPDHRFAPEPVSEINLYTLLFGIPEDGPKTEAALDLAANTRPNFPGAFSYMPEVLFQYGRNNLAYDLLLETSGPSFFGKDVGEVAFSVVGVIATGLMGLKPDASKSVLQTLPRLPKSLEWVRLARVPIMHNEVTVEHHGIVQSTVTNQAGPAIQWKVSFPAGDSSKTILVDGTPVASSIEYLANRQPVLTATVPVRPGQSRTAKKG